MQGSHYEYHVLGGATLGVIVAKPSKFTLQPERDPTGRTRVAGTLSPAPGRQGAQIRVDLLDGQRNLIGGKNVTVDPTGTFEVFFGATEFKDIANARYASTLFQGEANLTLPADTYQQGAYIETFIITGHTFLPVIGR